MSMGVDDGDNRKLRHRLDLIQDGLTIIGELRVYQDDSLFSEEDAAVPTGSRDHVKPVRYFHDHSDASRGGSAALGTAGCGSTLSSCRSLLCDIAGSHRHPSDP